MDVKTPDVTLDDISRLTPAEVCRAMNSRLSGLTTTEAAERLTVYGRNALREVRGTPLIYMFLANFVHLMALLLWAGGILAFIAQMPQLGVAVWAVILINAVFSFWQEFKAEKATEALKRLLPSYARVLRDNSEVKLLTEELVPGDVLLLAEGDNIPADGRFVEEYEVRTNNATLTGESAPVRKTAEAVVEEHGHTITELRNLAFAGTSVASGSGKVVIVSTGMNTQFGKIAAMTQSVKAEMSPLQKEMERVTRIITFLSVGLGVVFFLLGTLIVRMELVSAFLFAIGVIVANVPEGLLPTVTLALAMGVQRMVKRNALIKKLSSVETLGSTTVICTDKTGTLTQNAMSVREIWLPSASYRVTGIAYEPSGQYLSADGKAVSPRAGDLTELLRASMLCNNARLVLSSEDQSWSILGDPTEAALVVAAAKAGLTPESERGEYPRIFELPFESRRKCMTTIHQTGKAYVAFVKGAPNEILQRCGHILINGQVEPLTAAHKAQIEAANDGFARGALRVLAVARRRFDERPRALDVENIEHDLVFLGLTAMMDPPRPEVADAIRRCHSAGIRTVMITGDYGLTAESIARRIGLVHSGDVRIITGADLEEMPEAELSQAISREVIFARVAPEHKLRIVTAFQDKGEIVAVTGDGVNDAPALKKADIGVAMGITGTDVAKEAADMILIDDNFASIVNAIEEGRGVYDNIKKFVTYILASNVPELIPFIFMVLFNLPLALVVMQILAIDLGTDMLPALALGTEEPDPAVMTRRPRPQNELLLRAYLWLGMIESALCFIGFFVLIRSLGYAATDLYVACSALTGPAAQFCQTAGANGQIRVDLLPYAVRQTVPVGVAYVLATTIFHMGVVASQIGNVFACRTESASIFVEQGFRAGLRWCVSNRFLLVGIVVEIILINVLVYVQPFQSVFELGNLNPLWWLFIIGYAPILFLLEEGRKAIVRRQQRRGIVRSGQLVEEVK